MIEQQAGPRIPLTEKFFKGPEAAVFLTGMFFLSAYSLWLGGAYFFSPGQALSKTSFSIARLFIGTPAGVFLGYTMGFHQGFVIFVNMAVDTIVILILYPLLVFIFRELVKVSLLEPVKRRLLKTAEDHHQSIKKYGGWGLFLFVLFPLWGTGPVVGSMIGSLMKMKPWVNMSIVLSATLLSILIFSSVLKDVHAFVALLDPKAPMILVLSLAIIMAGTNLFRRFGRAKKGIE